MMFAFVFVVMVPLYNVLCDALGINGKTSGQAYTSVQAGVDESRLVTVQFVATNNEGMPWEFGPTTTVMQVHPGAVNETVFLARFRNSQVEIIHVETPDDPGRAFIHPGLGVRPMHACSCSKAIAAFTEPEFQDCIINGTLKAYTEHTKTTEADLRADFARIVQRGFADCDQEIDLGIASVAAPVYSPPWLRRK